MVKVRAPVAQYSSPFQILGRVNEVWVSFPTSDGCHAKLLNTRLVMCKACNVERLALPCVLVIFGRV